jgi:hypothetical protein
MPDMATNGDDHGDERYEGQETVYVSSYRKRAYHTDKDCYQINGEVDAERPRELLDEWGYDLCKVCEGTDDRSNKGPCLHSDLLHNDSIDEALESHDERQKEAQGD